MSEIPVSGGLWNFVRDWALWLSAGFFALVAAVAKMVSRDRRKKD